jgi:two-component system sensor histidine kinase PilS (NtrC family)
MLCPAMKNDTSQFPDLKNTWFMPLRLVVFLVVFGSILVGLRSRLELYGPLFAYSIITLAFLITMMSRRGGFVSPVRRALIMIQLLTEIYMESVIVYYSGYLASPFGGLFLLTIVSASLAYRLTGTLATATVASIAYVGAIWIGVGADLSYALNIGVMSELYITDDELFFTVFIHLCSFFLAAFISGYLADRIKAKDKELRDASEHLRRVRVETDDILRHLHSGLVTVDNHGRIVYFNEAAEKITGFSEWRIKGKNLIEVFGERMPEFTEKILAALKSSQYDIRSEISIYKEDDSILPLGMSTSILGDDKSGVRGVVAVFQDLTHAKEIEERIRRADRLAAVGELAAGIAHEIRNPLAAISGSVEVLRGELEFFGENERLMSLIIKESGRLNNILCEFLDYARVTRPSFSRVEINHLILEVFEIVRHNPCFHDRITLDHSSLSTTVYISGDENMFKQFMLNLVANAVEALTASKGNIEVTVESGDELRPDRDVSAFEWVKITVADNGPGLSDEQVERVFEPFFSTKKDGTGLGLPIVRRVVENLGGKIEFQANVPNGAKFVVYLRRYIDGLPSKPDSTPENGTQIRDEAILEGLHQRAR